MFSSLYGFCVWFKDENCENETEDFSRREEELKGNKRSFCYAGLWVHPGGEPMLSSSTCMGVVLGVVCEASVVRVREQGGSAKSGNNKSSSVDFMG